ncbi:MAG: hypothetical protein IRZ05_19475 [Micromonosporaceae bacterium]|jgi:hypothetical protein|nr:hypothetical protein [Micromonosporaceae bacterium]
MSTLGGGNGDGWPPEGGGQSDGLPGLPPEWGSVVIPDDPAELADEAAQVRRELRRQARRDAWRRRLRLPARAAGQDGQPSLGLPLLIMSIAVIATLTSLFAVAWPGRTSNQLRGPQASRGAPAGTLAPELADLVLADPGGSAVRVADIAPAALLLVDSCTACDDLVSATVAAAPDPVTVVVVGQATPTLDPSLGKLRRLKDPQQRLRERLQLGTPGGLAAVVLVARGGHVVHKLPGVTSVDSFRAELAQLT